MRPKTFKNTTQLHILLDESLLNSAKELASEEGIKYSAFIRRAIENEIAAIDKKKADIESPINKLKQ